MSPAEYYAKKDADARRLREELAEAIGRKAPEAEIRRLEHELRMAEYTGD